MLTSEFLDTYRQKGASDAMIDQAYRKKSRELGDTKYEKFRAKYVQRYGHGNLGKMLDFYAQKSALEESGGFVGRLKSSISSVPERFQRGFGSQEIRGGREEVSRGFDLADLPGDIADIIGPSLPFIGELAGGSVGFASGNLPGAVIGAGVGAGALEAGRQSIGDLMNVEEKFGEGKTDIQDESEVFRKAGIGAASELGGRIVMGVAGKLLRPFAKHFDADLARIAKSRGIELPASATTDAPLLQLTEQATGKGIFGGSMKELVDNAQKELVSQADDIVKGFGGADDIAVAGKGMVEGLGKYREAFVKAKNLIYKKASSALPSADRPATPLLRSALKDVLADKEAAKKLLGSSGGENILSNLQRAITKTGLKQPSLDELIAAHKELNELIKFGMRDVQATGSDAVLRKVSAAMDTDIMNHLKQFAPEAYSAAIRADNFYKEGIETLNSSFGKSIQALADEPTRIVDRVIRPRSPEQARGALELIASTSGGADRVANVQSAFVRELLDKATNNGAKALQGESLNNILNKYGNETLDAVIGEDARIAMQEIAKLARGLGKSRRIAEGSQTAFVTKVQAIITALMVGRVDLAASIVGGDALLTPLFKSGIGRKWMTEGLTSPTVLQQIGAVGSRGAGFVGGEILTE